LTIKVTLIQKTQKDILLLSDTKLTKYIIQLILIGNLTGYLPKVMQATPDIKRKQVA
jgi:hypothetical protein